MAVLQTSVNRDSTAQIETIYFIHHSHTDIGYTHDQPIVWDLHERFIDQAIDCTERWADRNDDAAFRWTVESTAVLWHWLQHASTAQIDRFAALERVVRIEVTGMLANITPFYDTDQLIESLQLLRPLREEYGFTNRHAMNCDDNGLNWPLVDVLLEMGIEAFSMAVNPHYGGAPFQRPNAFWWQGPSGRKLLSWNGLLYISGHRFGIGHADLSEFATVWWPRVQRHLTAIGYPLSSLMIQNDHPFGDNGSAYGGFADFIARWNAAGHQPRIKFATLAMWWDAVKAEADQLLTFRGGLDRLLELWLHQQRA